MAGNKSVLIRFTVIIFVSLFGFILSHSKMLESRSKFIHKTPMYCNRSMAFHLPKMMFGLAKFESSTRFESEFTKNLLKKNQQT